MKHLIGRNVLVISQTPVPFCGVAEDGEIGSIEDGSGKPVLRQMFSATLVSVVEGYASFEFSTRVGDKIFTTQAHLPTGTFSVFSVSEQDAPKIEILGGQRLIIPGKN